MKTLIRRFCLHLKIASQPKFATQALFIFHLMTCLLMLFFFAMNRFQSDRSRLIIHLIRCTIRLYIQMSAKLSLEEINRLANEEDSDQEIKEENNQDGYDQQFQNEPVEEMDNQFQVEEEKGDENVPVVDQMSEIKSEIQDSYPMDMEEALDEEVSAHQDGNVSKFKKDEDLSLAKSQFIQSQNLNIESNIINNKSNKKINKQSKGETKGKTNVTNNQNKPVKTIKQVKVKKQPAKVQVQDVKQQKKPKLSEQEIKEKMKVVQAQKQLFLKKKQEKQQKDEQIRRKQYQQAKKLQQERKQKNKKVLQQQKKKKKPSSSAVIKGQMKIQQEAVQIPEKRTDFTYTNMVKERKQMEKNIQKQIEKDNKNKLKKLLQKPQSQLKGEARKAAFLDQRKLLRQRQSKMRQVEVKEGDVLVVKKVKQEIVEAKKFNKEKVDQTNRAEKTIQELVKKLKDKEVKFFQKYSDRDQVQVQEFNHLSQLSPIQKFIVCFPDAKNAEQIFKRIDINGDGVLASQEIKQKLLQYQLDEDVINSVQELLDQNSDGSVSYEEFTFLVQRQLKKQKDYREIMGTLQMNDPLDLEAKILDMRAKMKFINQKTDQHNKNKNADVDTIKIDRLERQIQKMQSKWKKQVEKKAEGLQNDQLGVNTTANLANEAIRLKNQRNMKQAYLIKLRQKVKVNLAQKNSLLASRVEQNIRLEHEIFNLRNQIQETKLRFLSMKKIQANKRGYLERQSQKQKQLQEAYKKTKQYKISITDPGKQNQMAAERDEMRLLCAVLMIQRNYRKRKARGELQRLKAQKQ